MRFCVTRPHPRKAGHVTSEWLSGTVDAADATEEARALLADPRDTIIGVYLWSDRLNQYVNKWKRS